jgi:hypothetical protein
MQLWSYEGVGHRWRACGIILRNGKWEEFQLTTTRDLHCSS